jgi:MFS family permease
MLAALRQRNFAFLWFGQAIPLIGDWVLFVALPFYVYSLTGSTLATGIMFIVQTIPRIFFGSIAGVFVDRWNRKHTMFIAELLQALALVPLFLVHSQQWIWIVYVFAFVESIISQFFIPAKSAIIPNLVDEEHLLAANSLNSMSQELTRLVGPFLGGLLLGILGINSVIVVDTASFLVSAGMIALITLPTNAVQVQEHNQAPHPWTKFAKVWREWAEGLRLVRKQQLITGIFVVMGVAMVGEGIIEVLIAAYVKQVMHGNALVLGWLMTAQAIGGIAGSLIVVQLSKGIHPTKLIPLSALIFGPLIIVIVNIPVLPVVLPLITIIGVAVIGFFVSLVTLLQSNVADEYRGRIFGALNTVQAMALLFGMILASGLGDRIGVIRMLEVDAAFNILAGILAVFLIRKSAIPAPISEVEPEELNVVQEADTSYYRGLPNLSLNSTRCSHSCSGMRRSTFRAVQICFQCTIC